MPETPKKIWLQLGIHRSDDITSDWDSSKTWGLYPATAKVCKGDIIFPRIDIVKEMESLAGKVER